MKHASNVEVRAEKCQWRKRGIMESGTKVRTSDEYLESMQVHQ
jgi:hypothetical protein